MHLETILPTIGYIGIAFIIFAESGLLIGFFLPGDSLLFTAGFLASQGIFSVLPLALICFIAAVTGDSVGYAFGAKVGPKIFNKKDSLFFNKDHIDKTRAFYEKHGKKTIVLARFVPIVRTFAPIVAGVGQMEYATFFTYNLIGGLLWAVGLCFAGYYLGQLIPNVDTYLLPIIILIILLSILPGIAHFIKDKHSRDSLIIQIQKLATQVLKVKK